MHSQVFDVRTLVLALVGIVEVDDLQEILVVFRVRRELIATSRPLDRNKRLQKRNNQFNKSNYLLSFFQKIS